MNKRVFGTAGEDAAAAYLKKLGYKILERNYTVKIGEADIIALDGETLVFAEVKTRSSDRFGLPRESVTAHKQRKYSLIALYYIKQKHFTDFSVRFDVVDILDGRVTHIKNAFDFIP